MVSIIIPVYNAEEYLDCCLQTIARQTYKDLQVIVIDDGSTDCSLAIAERFAAEDDRFTIISQPNKGQAAARNRGLKKATGEYLCFIDADDFIDHNYIETLVTHIGNKDIIQAGYTRTDSSGKDLKRKYPLHFYQFTAPWARLYRRSALDGITFPEGMIYEDVVFSLRLWNRKPKHTILRYYGYHYRLNSLSTTARRNREAEQALYSRIKEEKAPIWLKQYTRLRLKHHFEKMK